MTTVLGLVALFAMLFIFGREYDVLSQSSSNPNIYSNAFGYAVTPLVLSFVGLFWKKGRNLHGILKIAAIVSLLILISGSGL